MKLRLSPRAKKDLKKIYAWFKEQANEKVAETIINDINSAIKLLPDYPNLGHLESDLENFPQSFRTYVLVPNYKLVYWLENEIVKIATVFDCRQKPEELIYIINTKTDWVCEPQVEYRKGN